MSTRTAASRPMILLAALSAIALSMIWLVSPAFATHVEPQFKSGNQTCGELGDYDHEFKIQPVESGDYSDPNSDFEVTLTVNDTPAGPTVDFESNLGVDALFVKGGDDGNLYVYVPPATEDTGLHAPLNPSGKWAGLSHLSFCFNDTPEEESESPSAEQSVESSASAEESVPESGEQSVKISTGTPEESSPDGALSLNGAGALPTIAFSLILLASLGGLAYANVKAARS